MTTMVLLDRVMNFPSLVKPIASNQHIVWLIKQFDGINKRMPKIRIELINLKDRRRHHTDLID